MKKLIIISMFVLVSLGSMFAKDSVKYYLYFSDEYTENDKAVQYNLSKDVLNQSNTYKQFMKNVHKQYKSLTDVEFIYILRFDGAPGEDGTCAGWITDLTFKDGSNTCTFTSNLNHITSFITPRAYEEMTSSEYKIEAYSK